MDPFTKINFMRPSFFKDLSIPAVAAPMFLISCPKLVIECCKNGVVGTLPALNQKTTKGFEEWIIEIKEALSKYEKETGKNTAPFGINLIVHPTNPRVMPDLQICIKYKVPIVITSLGAVSDLVDAVHSYGGLVFHDIIKRRHAEKATEAGVDGLILVAAGAGGHGGTINPMALINEVKTFFNKTILLSGCISNGNDIASALQMGADLAYMGTRFINVNESMADNSYQKMIMDSKAEDIIYTAAVSGVNASFLRPSLEAMGITEDLWKQTKKIDFGSELDHAKEEAKAWKTIWSAGQGVTSISDVKPVAELISQLKVELEKALLKQKENYKYFF